MSQATASSAPPAPLLPTQFVRRIVLARALWGKAPDTENPAVFNRWQKEREDFVKHFRQWLREKTGETKEGIGPLLAILDLDKIDFPQNWPSEVKDPKSEIQLMSYNDWWEASNVIGYAQWELQKSDDYARRKCTPQEAWNHACKMVTNWDTELFDEAYKEAED